MFYVYVLRCADNNNYIGFTANLEARVAQHNAGRVISTRTRVPAKPICFEGFLNKYDALRREGYFKTTAGKRTLKLMLREYYAEKQLTMPQRKHWGFVFSSQKNNVSRRSGETL